VLDRAAEQGRRRRQQGQDGGDDLEPGLAGLSGGARGECGVEQRREDRGEEAGSGPQD
jgi:hypothetical protein